MLEKSPGIHDISKLQIIHLFKGGFNFDNKWLGKTTMVQAESKELLAHEQYCSWNNVKDAIIQCLKKQLWYDYFQFHH